ncbi:rit1 DUSP-like domain-containing protein [Trichoderma breve]|uniref:Rit1 DUSP-like domain-containing protein n=1 Tax=Trichoderma breve TaxID=2034170 RepID=A0A9W9EBY0_9HYPO|nr:rit1 DUSP-like domain-containing protein [Trichoderma breve]KAJ4863875.1 rit1 DUSP-like domain-containing protein [Trichoderma breve]
MSSDDIFSNQPSISSLLTQLRRSTLTPHNRLKSIHADAAFVAQVASSFSTYSSDSASGPEKRKRKKRPLVANERCGSWYIPPDRKDGSAYFKSTDGHERAWKFSTRRLNLHLIDMIEENDGIIIVDSTRRGKRMPDALSTTIPIWCTVLNMALLPNNPLSSNLFLPPYLPASTHSQITALIPTFLSSLKELNLTFPTSLTKPLRPLWITQDSSLPPPPDSDNDEDEDQDQDQGVIFQEYRPVICCTASRRVIGSEVDEGGYIQGAGDDTENWALGLTPDIFWANTTTFLSAAEAAVPDLIIKLVEEAKAQRQSAPSGDANPATLPRKQLTPQLSVRPISPLDLSSPIPSAPQQQQPSECLILLTETPTPKETWLLSPTLLRVGLGKHKTASRNLRLALTEICSFATNFLQNHQHANETDAASNAEPPQIIVACDSGRDLSVGVALALSCYLFDDEGRFRVPDDKVAFTKTLVKMRLGAIMTVYPEANPSRSTLQSVNSFLMDWRN